MNGNMCKDPTFLLLNNMCVEYNTTTVVYALFCGNMLAFAGELRRWRGEARRGPVAEPPIWQALATAIPGG